MDSTEDLIASLAAHLGPVRRLMPPRLRALAWIVLACVVVALLVLLRGLRSDMDERIGDVGYWLQLAGAWGAGAAATLAAFEVSLPDRSRRWIFLPAPFALLWASGFAFGCLGDWIAIPEGTPVMPDSARCLETIVMASLPLALVLWVMLRRARPLRANQTAWLGGLAVAGFADTAHLLIHVIQASLLVLIVNLVPVTLIILLAGLLGGRRLAGS